MSSLLTELSESVRGMSTEERAQLVEGLLESLQEAKTPKIEAAWDTEVLRRIGEHVSGDAAFVPVADEFAQALMQ